MSAHTRRDVVRGLAAIGLAAPLVATESALALAQVTDATPVTGGEWPRKSDRISYGDIDPEAQALYIWTPEPRTTPRPGFVWFHGGGFLYGDPRDPLDSLRPFAEAGFVVFSVSTRHLSMNPNPTAEDTSWPTQLDDAQRAIRWMRAHAADFNLDPDRIGVLGQSSGSTLAALLGTMETRDNSDPALAEYSSRVTCVLAIEGMADFTRTPDFPHRALFGGTLEEKREVYEDASPVNHVDADTVPFLLMHGIDDAEVPVKQARLMLDALNDNEIEAIYVQWAGVDHGGALYVLGAWDIARVFLTRHLRPEE